MIVWGGSASSLPNKTGGRYDPGTDTWTPTSTAAPVPDGGTNSVAIWTGSEMIVWGGYNGFTSVGGGGRYDPATDTWTTTPTSNAPSGRSFATAVWTGTEMIVWGGLGNVPLDSGARYNPVTNAWTPVPASGAPVPRYKHTAVWTGSEMIVFGGTGSNDTFIPVDTGGRYDPWFDSWAPIATGSTARTEHTAVWTGSKMIVWGGTTYIDGPGWVYTNSGEAYAPSTNTWTPVSTGAASPTERGNHTAVWTGSTMLVFAGNTTPPPPMVNTGGEYDPQFDVWSPTSVGAGVPGARTRHTAVWTGSDMIVWGGDAQSSQWRTGGRYDASSDTWLPTGTTGAPAGRSGHLAVWTGSRMIVWGGSTGSSKPQNSGGVYCACPDGVLLYRDADGDGLGDPADVRSSCDGAAVVGYVANAGDCDDSIIENTAPAAATGMMFAADKVTITWTPTPGAVRYDVVRGRLDLFPVGPGGGSPPFGGDETCYSNLTAPVVIDPLFFGYYWYLVRGENRCGIGSWGTASNGTPRVTSTCP
jgi:N-acetylneuraminic acid mutarotase